MNTSEFFEKRVDYFRRELAKVADELATERGSATVTTDDMAEAERIIMESRYEPEAT